MRRATTALLSTAAVVPLLAACGTGGGGDVHVGGTFEGYTQVLTGIDGDPVPFRVFALTDPSRLVVDVVDDRAD